MTTASSARRAKQAGHDAKHSTTLDLAVRFGLVCFGIVHLLIAWIAVQLAFGTDTGSASGQGAMHQLAQQPFGQILLWLVGIGFLALVVWQLIETVVGYTDEDLPLRVGKRIASGFRVVLFAVLGAAALAVAVGSGGGGTSEQAMTARLMSAPAGRWLVGLVGVAIVAYGIGLLVVAVTRSFTDRLKARGTSGELGRATVLLGQAGHASKGVAIGIVGGLFAWAALTFDPRKAGGLDAALHALLGQPYGQAMLTVVGLGIGCYGVFCFVWARHLDK